jgi:hypothetical protein
MLPVQLASEIAGILVSSLYRAAEDGRLVLRQHAINAEQLATSVCDLYAISLANFNFANHAHYCMP